MATGAGIARARVRRPITRDDERSQPETSSTEEKIRQRAHEIWLQNEGQSGSALADWLQAEKEILGEKRKIETLTHNYVSKR